MGTINTNIRIDELVTMMEELQTKIDQRTEPFILSISGTDTEGDVPSGTIAKCLTQLSNFSPLQINFPDLNLSFNGYTAQIITDTDFMFTNPYGGNDVVIQLEISIINDDETYIIYGLT